MTKKQKQSRKKQIEDRAAAKKAADQERAEMVHEAEALEAAGKWGEAAIAWGVVADGATSSKGKKRAAGRKAAAKVRASASYKAIEDQTDAQAEHDDLAPAEKEAENQPAAHFETIPGDVDRADVVEDDEAKTNDAAMGTAPRDRDARLPPVGTVLVKKDRAGTERARCTMVDGGVEYGGEKYKSLSAAGLKAMSDLGLAAKTCDGFAFWGLKRGAPRAAKAIFLEPLQKAWDRYVERATALAASATGEARENFRLAVSDHFATLDKIVDEAADDAKEVAFGEGGQS